MSMQSLPVRRFFMLTVVVAMLLLQVPYAAGTTAETDALGPAALKSAAALLGAGPVVSVAADDLITDPGDDFDTAVALSTSPIAGTLDYEADPADVFSYTIPAGKRLRVVLSADPAVLLADVYVFDQWATAIDTDQALAGTSSDDALEVFSFDNTTLDDMPCYLAVAAAGGAGDYTMTWEVFDVPAESDDDIPGEDWVGPTVTDSVDSVYDHDDVFSVDVAEGQYLEIAMTDGAAVDADVYVYAPDAVSLATDLPVWGSASSDDAEYVRVDVRAGMAGTYYVCVSAASGSGSYTLGMKVATLAGTVYEDVATAVPIASSSGVIAGTLTQGTDMNDVWYMDLAAGERVTAALSGPADADFDLYVYGPDSKSLATEDPQVWSNDWTSEEYVVLDVEAPGRYYFEASVFSGSGAYEFTWSRTTTPELSEIGRLDGDTRYDTAIELCKSCFADDCTDYVVLASGQNYADALAASPLAGVYCCPLLLTKPTALPAQVLAEIERVGAENVFIVGGEAAVGTAVETALEDEGLSVTRLKGATRYSTATAIAEHIVGVLGEEWSGTVFLARGDKFADALSMAPLAYATGYPVLLTPPTALSPDTAAFMKAENVGDVIIVGGTGAVSTTVESAVSGLPSMNNVERIQGVDRYATSKAVADYGVKHEWVTPAYVGVATGRNYPDALGGGAVCGMNGGVLLLTDPYTLSTPVSAFITSHEGEVLEINVFGGTGAVSDDVATALNALVP